MPVLFISLLESSPSSEAWPAEIAWAVRGHDVETHLIRPTADWADWSAESETLHGLSLDYLTTQGEPAAVVARRAAEVLAVDGAAVFLGAEGQARLLDRLLRLVGAQEPHRAPVSRLYNVVARRLMRLAPPPENGGHPEAIRLLEDEACKLLKDTQAAELARQRVRHRAGADAAAMVWLLDNITARVESRLAAS